jgi:sulfatase modifying factor 1
MTGANYGVNVNEQRWTAAWVCLGLGCVAAGCGGGSFGQDDSSKGGSAGSTMDGAVGADVNNPDSLHADSARPLVCGADGAVTVPSSCTGRTPGTSADCGAAMDDCCASPLVPCGVYSRGNDTSYPASVSSFRLDKYEATVGRFRAFVNAYPGSKPTPGAGMHPLVGPSSGWLAGWEQNLPVDQAALRAALLCNPMFQTWTDMPAEGGTGGETLPINCVSWYEAFAFCAWDGGRLPTEAEWNYAAAGGAEQRTYPWGPDAPDATLAVYDCLFIGASTCEHSDIAPVGSRPRGSGKWKHADLAGNMIEWTLDLFATPYSATSCSDCSDLTTATAERVARGGSYRGLSDDLLTSARRSFPPGRGANIGIRCARTTQ